MVPRLAELIPGVLEGKLPLGALLECAEETNQAAEEERYRILSALRLEREEVQAGVQREAQALDRGFFDFLRLLDGCELYAESFDRQILEGLLESLPAAARRLEQEMYLLQEGLWICRGPSSHAGINRLLRAVQGVEEERESLACWAQALGQVFPPALCARAREWAAAAQQWLAEVPADERDLPAWREAGQALGQLYTRLDPYYVWRFYEHTPTPFPLLNLVLNSAWLHSRGHLCREVVDFYLERLRAETQKLRQGPRQEDLAEVEGELEKLLGQIGRWLDRGESEDFERFLLVAVELGQELHELLGELPAAKAVQSQGRVAGLLQEAELLLREGCSPGLEAGLSDYTRDLLKFQQSAGGGCAEVLQRLLGGVELLRQFQADPDLGVLQEARELLLTGEQLLLEVVGGL